jgi:hypothetical protein
MCNTSTARDQKAADRLSELVLEVTGHYVRPEGLSLLMVTEWTRVKRLAHLIHGSASCEDADDTEVRVEAELAKTTRVKPAVPSWDDIRAPAPVKKDEPAKTSSPTRIAVERNGQIQIYILDGHTGGPLDPGETVPLVKAK